MTIKQFKDEIGSSIHSIERYDWCTCKWIDTDGILRYRMYQTDIVTVRKNTLILNVDTWCTRTTKDKLNEILGLYLPTARIIQNKSTWYYTSKDDTMRFFNGIKIHTRTGKVLNASKGIKEYNRKDKLKKLIDKYCTKLSKRVTLPYPNSGDCWYCSIFDDGSSEHLLSHLKEGYIHGSLILRALKARGYTDPYFVFELGKTKIGTYTITCIDDSTRSVIIKAVRYFFKDTLGIPR